MTMRSPPTLPEELQEQILLRVPPDDPARFLRTAIASKRWCRIVSEPGFRRRYRDLHGSPPLLGVIYNTMDEVATRLVRFAPTSSFRPPRAERLGWAAVDSRHGRVLLRTTTSTDFSVAVWDPIRDVLLQMPRPPWRDYEMHNCNGAVLCAGNGCDHLDCQRGPFLVVFVAAAQDFANNTMYSYVYSSETNAWTKSTHGLYFGPLLPSSRGALVENALYFVLEKASAGILKYDLATREITAIVRPPMTSTHIAPMTAEGGGLGCATLSSSELCLWSAEVVAGKEIGWAIGKTIELSRLVPAGSSICRLDVTGFLDGGGVVYVGTDQGSFVTNLKSGSFNEVRDPEVTHFAKIVPYMSFHTPALPLQ